MRRPLAYSEYRDSGIDWLGQIPAHWDLQRLGSTVTSSQNGVWGDEAQGDENDIACIRVADFDRQGLVVREPEDGFTIRNVSTAQYAGRVLKQDDLLLEKSGGGEKQLVGAVVRYQLKGPAVCSNFVSRVVLEESHDAVFLTYLHFALYAARVNFRSIKQSTGIQNLDEKQYFSEVIALPCQEEQKSIADFLDRETAKIDALVEKKEQLIELLQEKRIALITHAVTNGIDPNVPLKDSGIEWLGQIPVHWEPVRIKNVADMRAGTAITSEDIDETGEYPVYGGNGLRGYTSSFTHEGEYVLVGRQGALCGNVNYASGTFWASEHAVVATPLGTVNVRWLGEVLRSMRLNELSVAAAQPGLAVDRILSQPIALPPVREQRAIADFLDHETAKIDALIAKIQEAIERLKEYRTALISAAVTGKIDVRGLVENRKARTE